MKNRILVWAPVVLLFFFIGLAVGDYSLPGSMGAENLSRGSPIAQSLEANTVDALAEAMAPQQTATEPGTESALYTNQMPLETNLKGLVPFDVKESAPNLFYKGSYQELSGFNNIFPSSAAWLWIERSTGWSWYATMPLEGWARELLYVPIASPVYLYEIYPDMHTRKYDLGFAQPGYYYIWYYADTPGRYLNVLGVSGDYSNTVVIDVYAALNPKPTPSKPDPKKECEKRGFPCYWQDGKCNCQPAPNPVDECEKKPGCTWANGECQCFTPVPNPVAECEKQPGCTWANGECQCFRPVPNPNPGPQPNPEPPGPVPNPTPDDTDSLQSGT